MRHKASNLTGPALISGGLLFVVFWMVPATESAGLGLPWAVSLAVHGAQIITLGTGLVLAMRVPPPSLARYLWLAGLGVAAVGTFIGLPLFAAGVVLVGAACALTGGLRMAGLSMILGAVLWMVLFSTGAMIGNEDYPPLTGNEQRLAVGGLVLMATGLVTLGAQMMRWNQAAVPGSSMSGSEGLRTSSQSTPATTTAPATSCHTGES
jgi:hypothetical protein